jgi:hypothetical protein
MPSPDFPDDSDILFGREKNLIDLQERATQSGITEVVARPQMGKSWLLMELARRLSLGKAPREAPLETMGLLGSGHYLVGFSSAEGSTPDQMLRALVNLYTRWGDGSSFRQQSQLVFRHFQGDLVGRTGEAVGTIVKELSKTGESLLRLSVRLWVAVIGVRRPQPRLRLRCVSASRASSLSYKAAANRINRRDQESLGR